MATKKAAKADEETPEATAAPAEASAKKAKKSKKDGKAKKNGKGKKEGAEDAPSLPLEAADAVEDQEEDVAASLPEVVEPSEEDAPEPEKVKTSFEGLLSRAEAVAYFESVVEGLKKGTIQFKQGDDTLTLTPSPHVAVAIKASRKGAKQKLAFKMSWRDAPDSELSISHDE